MAVDKLVVVDTNVLVSGLLSDHPSPPVHILALIEKELLSVCYDERVWAEYVDVLGRAHFGFNQARIQTLLNTIQYAGLLVTPFQLEQKTSDPDDQAFYEVAALCFCPLVTGNMRDYPNEPHIMAPAEYLEAMREE